MDETKDEDFVINCIIVAVIFFALCGGVSQCSVGININSKDVAPVSSR